jgi:hypothetical protein
LEGGTRATVFRVLGVAMKEDLFWSGESCCHTSSVVVQRIDGPRTEAGCQAVGLGVFAEAE